MINHFFPQNTDDCFTKFHDDTTNTTFNITQTHKVHQNYDL